MPDGAAVLGPVLAFTAAPLGLLDAFGRAAVARAALLRGNAVAGDVEGGVGLCMGVRASLGGSFGIEKIIG